MDWMKDFSTITGKVKGENKMFEIICDSCGESIGSCSKDLSNETVYCEECTPSTDDPDDDDPVADDTKKEEEEEV